MSSSFHFLHAYLDMDVFKSNLSHLITSIEPWGNFNVIWEILVTSVISLSISISIVKAICWSSLVISTSAAVVARLIALLPSFTESLKVFLFPLIPLCEEFFVPATTKGQLISKANSKLFIWTKEPMKIFLCFCPSSKKHL